VIETQHSRSTTVAPGRSAIAPAPRAAGVAPVFRAATESLPAAARSDELGRLLASAVAARCANAADGPLLQRLAQIDVKKPRAIIKDKVFLTSAQRKHIFDRHAPPAEAGAGEFSQTLWDDATELYTKMASAIGAGGGAVDAARQSIVYEETYGAPIGKNSAGAASSRMRVVTTLKGMVVTAFPI
jgi:hypothetical protein